MMKKKLFANYFIPLFIVFAGVNLVCMSWQARLANMKIDSDVVMIGNVLLFALSVFTCWMHGIAIKAKNANASIRNLMMANLIKMMVLATAVLIYIRVAGKDKNRYGIYVLMFLYIVYTFIEVRIALKKQQTPNANS